MITNLVSLSRHFRRAYYADRSFLQSTLDNVFFSVNDVLPAPKKSYKESLAIPSKSVEPVMSPPLKSGPLGSKSVESLSAQLKLSIPARLPDQQNTSENSPRKLLVQLSPRNMPNNSTAVIVPSQPQAIPEANTKSLPMPLTPPVTPPDNPWQTVPNARFSRFRSRPRALSSPNLFAVAQESINNAGGANSSTARGSRNGSPRTGSPRTTSPRVDPPRSGSPRVRSTSQSTTDGHRHSHKHSTKQSSPGNTPIPSANTSPRIADNPSGYSSESESTSPRNNTLKPSKLSSASSPNNTPKPPPAVWKSALSPKSTQTAVEILRSASRSYLAVVQNGGKQGDTGSSAVAGSTSISPSPSVGSTTISTTISTTVADQPRESKTTISSTVVSAPSPPTPVIISSGGIPSVGVVKFSLFNYESDSSYPARSYNKQHIFPYDDDSDLSSDEGGGLSSSSGGDFSSDGSTQSSDGSSDAIPQATQTQRVPKINFSNSSTAISSTTTKASTSSQTAPPLVVLSPRSSSSSSSPSTASPNSSPPCPSTFEALVSPRRTLVGPTGGAVSNPLSPRVPSASPRNSGPLVFGSNPLSPRNVHSNSNGRSAAMGYMAPRNARTIERRSSLLNIVPESPSGNFRAVNFLTEEEKVTRMNILQLLIHTGVLPGDLSDYPIRNVQQLGTAAPLVNHKLGILHKKISACLLDYLNFACKNVSELEAKIYDKYVYLYINGIDSDSDDEEQNARRRRLWNVGNSGKESFRTTVELLNWLQYETTHSPVFYSICKEELVSRDFFRHCRKCRTCFDWQYLRNSF